MISVCSILIEALLVLYCMESTKKVVLLLLLMLSCFGVVQPQRVRSCFLFIVVEQDFYICHRWGCGERKGRSLLIAFAFFFLSLSSLPSPPSFQVAIENLFFFLGRSPIPTHAPSSSLLIVRISSLGWEHKKAK